MAATRWGRRWAVSSVALGFALTSGRVGLEASGEWEVFEQEGSAGYDIYIRKDSGETRRLTRHPADDRYPALSHDGRRVAFASGRDGDMEIRVVGMDGGDERQVTRNGWDDRCPAWAVGDSQIVFVANPEGIRDLYVVSVAGGEPRRLSREGEIEYEPAWIPDMLDRDHQPTAWLEATTAGPNRVRFLLAGTRDREEGRAIHGRMNFGDGKDTTFSRVPERLQHDYASEGTYRVVLYVQDSAGHGSTVHLELVLRPGIRLQGLRDEDTREFQPRPLDR